MARTGDRKDVVVDLVNHATRRHLTNGAINPVAGRHERHEPFERGYRIAGRSPAVERTGLNDGVTGDSCVLISQDVVITKNAGRTVGVVGDHRADCPSSDIEVPDANSMSS